MIKKKIEMKHNRTITIVALCYLLFQGCLSAQENKKSNYIIANPMNLNYRFCPFTGNENYRREAADPVLEYFRGKYYLFASKSGGYWSSPDLANWTYIPCKTITSIENYAPTILIHNDAIYYMGSGSDSKIFKNTTPDIDNWELIDTKFRFQLTGNVDPAFFKDDDGRVYMYWGCSNRDPIIGVEVDPENGFQVIGEAKILIEHRFEKYGWENPGVNNQENRSGYNEGPCMIKHNGKYYLQYAAPGTQWRIYGDGIYISDNPLGPFTYDETSPFSFKPGGFIGGAGHGHTFKDKYGNYWHIASMKISVRHIFERRLGIFPAYMTKDGHLHTHTVLTDYPFEVPQGKVNFEKNDFSKKWNLLSYEKKVTASSFLSDYEPEKAVEEQVETWWSAKTGNTGEWYQVDLGKPMQVNAVQVNFSDQDILLKGYNTYFNYQYVIECSDNGSEWKQLIDRKNNIKDMPHELIVLDNPVKTRFLRITNTRSIDGKFSLSGFRVFGNGKGEAPMSVSNLKVSRQQDRRRFEFTWDKVEGASGYIIRWGIDKNQLKNATMIMGVNKLEAGYFNRDSRYCFSIDSFNENDITKGKTVYEVQ
ncbi:hypothetical protein EZS27_002505 [termite gut metagenome]|uniref:F5/8 type C domain-containing protein n=1 Tax=termite gut metagenome TaxID=433724 RepID=A0A5J4SWL3_9ZZZZ